MTEFSREDRDYISTLMQTRNLTTEEQTALAELLALGGSAATRAREALWIHHSKMAVAMAAKFAGYGISRMDLIQAGLAGVGHALGLFDPKRGVPFSAYAAFWIRAYIQNHIVASWTVVELSRSGRAKSLFLTLRRRIRESQDAARDMGIEFDRPAALATIASEMGMSVSEVERTDAALRGRDESIDAPINGSDDDDRRTLAETLVDPAPNPEQATSMLEEFRRYGLLRDAVQALPPRQRRVIEARWLCEPNAVVRFDDIAADFGVSRERVRQIENDALLTLRRALASLSDQGLRNQTRGVVVRPRAARGS